ncbi:MAG TPA: tetratricopeptide repeat protein, partial [Croceibacterium sp.]
MNSTGVWCRDVIAIAALLCASPALAQPADPVATIERAEAAMLDGKRDQALRLAEQAAAPCMAPGPEAQACIYVLDTAASAANVLRRYDLAVRWFERSLALSRETLGASHPATVLGQSNYALALRDAYRFADATA